MTMLIIYIALLNVNLLYYRPHTECVGRLYFAFVCNSVHGGGDPIIGPGAACISQGALHQAGGPTHQVGPPTSGMGPPYTRWGL